MVTDYQKSLTSAVQPPNGNLSTTQQIQQLVQPTASLINLLQHAQAQVQQQQQQQQKPYPQQVPLPLNTTITPVSSRQPAYLPAAGQQKPVASYSPAKPSQSKQSQAAQARRNTANLPKSTPILPPPMSSQANLKSSTAFNYTAAKLAPNVGQGHYGGSAKAANVPPPLPNVSISKVQVTTGDSSAVSRSVSNVPVNASIKSDAHSPQKVNVSVAPPVGASPPKLSIPTKSEKLSPAPKANAPISPRTKQTPRKNSNPIRTTPPSASAVAQNSSPVTKPDVAATAPKPAATIAPAGTVQPQPSQQPQQKPQPQSQQPPQQQPSAAVQKASGSNENQQKATQASGKPSSPARNNVKAAKPTAAAPATPAKPAAAAQVTPTAKSAAAQSQAVKTPAAESGNAVVTKTPTTAPTKETPAKASTSPPKPATPATPKPEKKTSVALAASTPKPVTPSNVDQKIKRNRLRTIPYQSPIPEIELISKLTASEANNSSKNTEDKLIIFYKWVDAFFNSSQFFYNQLISFLL